MEIKVKIVSQYGNKRIFPACSNSDLFCCIAGTSTLTMQAIDAIKELGFKVSVIPSEPVTL